MRAFLLFAFCLSLLMRFALGFTTDLSTMFSAQGHPTINTTLVSADGGALALLSGSASAKASYVGWECSNSTPCAMSSQLDVSSQALTVEMWVTQTTYRVAPLFAMQSNDNFASQVLCSEARPLFIDFQDNFVVVVTMAFMIDGKLSCEYVSLPLSGANSTTFALILSGRIVDDETELHFTMGSARVRRSVFGTPLFFGLSQKLTAYVGYAAPGWLGELHKLSITPDYKSTTVVSDMIDHGLTIRPPFLSDMRIDISNSSSLTISLINIAPHVLPYAMNIVEMSDDTQLCISVINVYEDEKPLLVSDLPVQTDATVRVSFNLAEPECFRSDKTFTISFSANLVNESLATVPVTSAVATIYTESFHKPTIPDSEDVFETFSSVTLSSLIPSSIESPVKTLTLTSLPAMGEMYAVYSSGVIKKLSTTPVTLDDMAVRFKFSPQFSVRGDNAPLNVELGPDDLIVSSFSFTATSFYNVTSDSSTRTLRFRNKILLETQRNVSVPSSQNFIQSLKPVMLASNNLNGLLATDFHVVLAELPSFGAVLIDGSTVTNDMLPLAIIDWSTLSFKAPGTAVNTGNTATVKYFWSHKYYAIASAVMSSFTLLPAQVNIAPSVSFSDDNDTHNPRVVGHWIPLNITVDDATSSSTSFFVLTANTTTPFLYLRSNINSIVGARVISETSRKVQVSIPRDKLDLSKSAILAMGVAPLTASLDIQVDDVDPNTWSGYAPQVKSSMSFLLDNEVDNSKKPTVNSVFLDSSLMLGLLIGIPCLILVIIIAICIRRRVIAAKAKSIDAEKRSVLDRIAQSQCASSSSFSLNTVSSPVDYVMQESPVSSANNSGEFSRVESLNLEDTASVNYDASQELNRSFDPMINQE